MIKNLKNQTFPIFSAIKRNKLLILKKKSNWI